MKITKEKDELVIKIPFSTTRSNPYMEDYHPKMDKLIGVIEGEYDYGFCYRIDMEYKDKGDQWTDWVIKVDKDMEQDEFIKLCKKLKIGIVE